MPSPVDSLRLTQIWGLTHEEQADLDEMIVTWKTKLQRNLLRASYYDGKHAARDLGGNLTPPHLRKIALVLGWTAKAVDHLNRRCKLETFTGGPESLPIDKIYDDNWLGSEASQVGVASLIYGTAFLVASLGDETSEEPPALITSRSALEATGIWNARARRLRAFLVVNKTDETGEPSEMTYMRHGEIITITKRAGVGWNVERRSHDYGLPVEPLVYKPRLDRPFGHSRISRPVMSINNMALRTVLRSETTAELYQVPQRVLLGSDESSFKDEQGNVKPMWQSVLGLIWAIPDDLESDTPRADIKQLPGAPQDPYLAQLRMQAQLFAGETAIPISSLGIGGEANPTSAEAYTASREDLIAEAEGTTDGWTPAWKRTMLTAAAMLEGVTKIPEEWQEIEPKWRSPMFTSRASAADAGSKQLATVPWLAETEVGLELLGLTPDQIRRAMSERRRLAGRQIRQQLPAIQQAPLPNEPDNQAVIGNGAING